MKKGIGDSPYVQGLCGPRGMNRITVVYSCSTQSYINSKSTLKAVVALHGEKLLNDSLHLD